MNELKLRSKWSLELELELELGKTSSQGGGEEQEQQEEAIQSFENLSRNSSPSLSLFFPLPLEQRGSASLRFKMTFQ